MAAVVVKNVPFELDVDQLLKSLRVRPDSPYVENVKRLATEAREVANPKAVYKPAYIDGRGDNFVVIDGVTFTSRTLRINLEEAQRVFPYVFTCGVEVEEWSDTITDMVDQFCADTIKETILMSARRKFWADLDEQFQLTHTSYMSPGSLPEWPITEQKPLFRLLGDVEALIGVKLLDSCLMYPVKSTSGIHFPKEVSFESCQLCPRGECPGRKAPYDQELKQKYK